MLPSIHTAGGNSDPTITLLALALSIGAICMAALWCCHARDKQPENTSCKKKKEDTNWMHHMVGMTLSNWIRVVTMYGGACLRDNDLRYKFFFISFFILIQTPLRLLDLSLTVLTYPFVKRAPRKPPIFIVGHWRSGTTFLHNFMSQDDQFGYVSIYQTFFPASFRWGFSRMLMRWLLPKERVMDKIKYHLDDPQEEEFALANLCPYSSYLGLFYFPSAMEETFRKWTLMDGITDSERRTWESTFQRVVNDAHDLSGKEQILLKNPCNTARVAALLKMYPDAKFIHIYRHPVDVFYSSVNMLSKMESCKLQDQHGFLSSGDAAEGTPEDEKQTIAREAIKEQVLDRFTAMMTRFETMKHQIPSGNLAEVKFEEFRQNPISELKSIYQSLGITGFPEAKLLKFLSSIGDYKQNSYDMSNTQEIDRIADQWDFALKKWGYSIGEDTALNRRAGALSFIASFNEPPPE